MTLSATYIRIAIRNSMTSSTKKSASRKLLLGLVAGVSVLGLAACGSPDAEARRPRPPDNTAAKAWIERRTQQLTSSGLKSGDAAQKAAAEWSHGSLNGSGLDNYQIYDSAAKQKAEQQKINEGFEKLQKDR